jgi:hypothetical protein
VKSSMLGVFMFLMPAINRRKAIKITLHEISWLWHES